MYNYIIFAIIWGIFIYSIYVLVHSISIFDNNSEQFSVNSSSGFTNGFSWNNKWMGRQALDCYSLPSGECMNYGNCGLCLKDGVGTCVPGDEQGPLFKDDCQSWAYTNYNDRHVFGEKILTITNPWSTVLPDYETIYPSRQVIQTL